MMTDTSLSTTIKILLAQAAVLPISLGTGILVARILGAEGRGVYAFVQVLLMVAVPFVGVGTDLAIRYYLTARLADIGESFFSLMALSGIHSLAFGCLLTVAWRLGILGETGALMDSEILLIAVASGFLMVLSTNVSKVILSAGRFGMNNLLTIIRATALALTSWILIVLIDGGVKGALYAVAITLLIVLTVQLVFVVRTSEIIFRLDRSFLAGVLKYGLKAWPGSIAANAQSRLDQLLLGILAHSSALGNYNIAVVILSPTLMIPDSAGLVMYNDIAGQTSAKQRRRKFFQFLTAVLVAVVFTALAAVVFGRIVISTVLGEEFTDAAGLITILSFAFIFSAGCRMFSRYLLAIDKPGKNSRIQIAITLTSLVVFSLAIKNWGAIGLGVANILVWSGAFVVYLMTCNRVQR